MFVEPRGIPGTLLAAGLGGKSTDAFHLTLRSLVHKYLLSPNNTHTSRALLAAGDSELERHTFFYSQNL